MWRLLVISAVVGHQLREETIREGRDLVLENMVMRTKKYKPQDNQASPMVGGGILERKIISARNGTEGNHAEDREMECCHQVLVGGDHFGGVHLTHPYITGKYKKIGVCDGRSLYQAVNNTEIFMYYVCGRWFIGLEVGLKACLCRMQVWLTIILFKHIQVPSVMLLNPFNNYRY